jgi:hypothetical protein
LQGTRKNAPRRVLKAPRGDERPPRFTRREGPELSVRPGPAFQPLTARGQRYQQYRSRSGCQRSTRGLSGRIFNVERIVLTRSQPAASRADDQVHGQGKRDQGQDEVQPNAGIDPIAPRELPVLPESARPIETEAPRRPRPQLLSATGSLRARARNHCAPQKSHLLVLRPNSAPDTRQLYRRFPGSPD